MVLLNSKLSEYHGQLTKYMNVTTCNHDLFTIASIDLLLTYKGGLLDPLL